VCARHLNYLKMAKIFGDWSTTVLCTKILEVTKIKSANSLKQQGSPNAAQRSLLYISLLIHTFPTSI
jgi:hypothetical protein